MKYWRIPVVYQMMGVVEIEADTLGEAVKIVKDPDGIIPLPDDAAYLDDSWEVAMEDIEGIRELYNRNQED